MMPRNALIAFLTVCIAIIISLPYTGLLDSLVWRMPAGPDNSAGKNIAQQLGFEKNTKLLVINSDDTGASPSFSHGAERVLQKGLVQSTSIIVHDRNDGELARIATLSQSHPQWGFGVHLMLTNEYQAHNPWAPVLPKTVVPTLYNANGLAWATVSEVEFHVNPFQAELEFKAQVQKALDAGIDVTHLDSHMGAYYRTSRFVGAKHDALTQAAINTALHFDLPITLNTFDKNLEVSMHQIDAAGIIRPDTFFGFYELEEMNSHFAYRGSFLRKQLVAWVVRQIYGFELPYENQPEVANDVAYRMSIYKMAVSNVASAGLNHIFIHSAEERGASAPIPQGKNHSGGVDRIVRLSDLEVWASDEMQKFLREENVVLLNYQRLRDLQRAR